MDLPTALVAFASGSDRANAEQALTMFEQSNPTQYCVALSEALATDSMMVEARRLAGIVLKNMMHAKERARAQLKAQNWCAIDANARSVVKNNTLRALASELQPVRRAAAQVSAEIAAIELPHGMWNEIVPILCQNVATNTNPIIIEASLETLGFICEATDEKYLEPFSDSIIGAVMYGMRTTSLPENVHFAACNALFNSLPFFGPNFDVDNERAAIMSAIISTCRSQESPRLRFAAYECLVSVVETYYDKLEPHIGDLFTLTFETMSSNEEETVKQAIEFWSSVADREVELLDDGEPCRNFIERALGSLMPQLLQLLLKQSDDQDEETWDVAMAAGTCVSLVAAVTGDHVVAHVSNFIRDNIAAQSWRQREAALMAFGSILDGPKTSTLKPLLDLGLGTVLDRMKDENVAVRDTASWTMGRICEHHSSAIDRQHFSPLFQRLLESLTDEPRVATHVCWAILNLAESNDDSDSASGVLSPMFQTLVGHLLVVVDRQDADEHNLRSAAFEAINQIVQSGAQDTLSFQEMLLPAMLARLEAAYQMPVNSTEDKNDQNTLQAHLIGILQVLAVHLEDRIAQHTQRMLNLFFGVFNYSNTSLHTEALLAIGAVVNAMGNSFFPYMDTMMRALAMALNNVDDHETFHAAVGVVGDCARALEDAVSPYADQLLQLLIAGLRHNDLKKSVKPAIMSCIGDVALAISGKFEPYVPHVMPLLLQACSMPLPETTLDEVDFVNKFRLGLLEAFTGVIQGLASARLSASLGPHAQQIVQFCQFVASSQSTNDGVAQAALAVIGDLSSAVRSPIAPYVKQQWVAMLLQRVRQTGQQDALELAAWVEGKLATI